MTTDDQTGRPYEKNRFFLKDVIRQQIDFSRTMQGRHEPAPPLQKPSPPDSARIRLPDGASALARLGRMSIGEAIAQRESVRDYAAAPFTLEELSALLWATQGVRRVVATAFCPLPAMKFARFPGNATAGG